VVIRTASNRFESVCHHPLGDPANPMRWEGLVDKFRNLSQAVLSKQRQEDIIRAVNALPNQGVGTLLDLLLQPIDLAAT
jgi:2-methylcitrate dehydratase PrpD